MLLCLAACESKYGAYLTVEAQAGTSFDRVQFYFGKYAGDSVPWIPRTQDVERGRQMLMKRLPADNEDAVAVPAGSARATYYVPSGPVSEHVGQYVLAIAYQGDTPVGAAELFDVAVPDTQVFEYTMTLEPFGAVERWGSPDLDCVMWTRSRDGTLSTVAVVRGGDHDCDASASEADCDDMTYCPPDELATCGAAVNQCVTETCELGVCMPIAGTGGNAPTTACVATTCLDKRWCESCSVDGFTPDLENFFECASGLAIDHHEIAIPVKEDGNLCANPYVIYAHFGFGCRDPKVVYPPPAEPDQVQVHVEAATDVSKCVITLRAGTTGVVDWQDLHLQISVASTNASLPRTIVTLGVHEDPNLTCLDYPVERPSQTGDPVCGP